MELEYKQALAETGLTKEQLPADLNRQINGFNLLKLKADKEPNNEKLQNECHAKDSMIADAITDFYENDFEQDPNEQTNQQSNNMTTEEKALAARAKKVGLPENASEAQVVAKETEIANAANQKTKADQDAEKAKADKEAADKDAADKAEAAAKAKAKAEQEQDVLDDLDL